MDNLSDRKNIKFGVILSFVSLGVSIIGTLFITNRVLNYIGDYNYGLYSFVNSITSWLSIVSAALSASFLRFATSESKKNQGDVRKVNSIYFLLLLFVGIGVALIGLSIVGGLYFSHVQLGKYDWADSSLMYGLFAISILNIAFSISTSVFSLFVNYKKKFIFGKLLIIFTTALNFAGHFFIAFFSKSILLLSAWSIVITGITAIMNFVFASKWLGFELVKTKLAENKALLRSIVVFSAVVFLNAIVDQINSMVDRTLLGIFSTPNDVTIYQMGQQFSVYLVTMSVAVSGVFAPTIHELNSKGKEEEINALYLKISKSQTIILCLVSFGFLACGYNFVLWWIGPERSDAYYVGAILMLIDLCPLTMNSSIEIQRARNKHLFRAIVYIAVALANIGLSIAFLYMFPIQYAIFACLLGSVIARICSHWIAMNIYNKKEMRLPVGKYMLELVKYCLIGLFGAAIVMILSKALLDTMPLSVLDKFLIEGLLFVLLYAASVFVFDRKIFLSFFSRFLRKGEKGPR